MRFESKDNEATLWVYDAIGEMFGPDAISAKGVAAQLANAPDVKQLTIRVNSPGGVCDEACAIHTLLKEHPAQKIVKIDGVAASAAATLAMAGDKIMIAPGAMMMIHNPWSIAVGDGDAMRKAAEVADKYRDSTAGLIAKRTGKRMNTVLTAMASETWFTAQEAVDWKLADEAGIEAAVKSSKEDGERIINFAKEVARIAAMALVVEAGSDAADAVAAQALEIGRKINAANRARQLDILKAKRSA